MEELSESLLAVDADPSPIPPASRVFSLDEMFKSGEYADLYALGLLSLALTGIFIIPGKKGLMGRGRVLLLAGMVVPLVFIVLTLL